MNRVYIIGVGMTRVGRHYDKTLKVLISDAALEALKDAGFPKIDAIYFSNAYAGIVDHQENIAPLIADSLGCHGIPAVRIECSCSSGGVAVHEGFKAIASGIHDVVLVIGAEKLSDLDQCSTTSTLTSSEDVSYESFQGLTIPGAYALMTRQYMQTFQVSEEDLAIWPVLMHEHAYHNPYAQIRRRITVRDVIESNPVADPIKLLDCFSAGDGAAAIVMASEKIAKGVRDRAVEVIGIGAATSALHMHERPDLTRLQGTVDAARQAYTMAKLTPKDIQVIELHDAFTITGIISLEDLGIVGKGEGVKFVAEGMTSKDGKVPTNLSGGLKARGHPVGATGIYQTAEVALQLRGEFPGLQAQNDPEVGLVHNVSGTGALTTVTILRKQ
ncbi:MAG: thiolase domain-containing protein [Candidatus Baldrarchaeia archaeon]